MAIEFRWNEWNLDNATKHGVTSAEAEHVVRFARRPYPKKHDADKWLAVGRGNSARMLEVIFVYDSEARDSIYIIHAMPVHGHRARKRRRR